MYWYDDNYRYLKLDVSSKIPNFKNLTSDNFLINIITSGLYVCNSGKNPATSNQISTSDILTFDNLTGILTIDSMLHLDVSNSYAISWIILADIYCKI